MEGAYVSTGWLELKAEGKIKSLEVRQLSVERSGLACEQIPGPWKPGCIGQTSGA